jgi:hypothetical protein
VCSSNKIRRRKRAGQSGEKRNSLAFQSGNPKERGHLVVEGLDGRNCLEETGYDGMECIRLRQSGDQLRTLLITEMNLHVRQKAGRFVTILAAVGV